MVIGWGAIAHGNRGFAYSQVDEPLKAMEDYIIAYQLDPSLEWVRNNANTHIATYFAISEDDFAEGEWIPDPINGGRPNAFGEAFQINFPCGALSLTAYFNNVHRFSLDDGSDTFVSQTIFYYLDSSLAEEDYELLADTLTTCDLTEVVTLDDELTENAVLYALVSENSAGEVIGTVYNLYYQDGNVIEVLTYGASGEAASTLDPALVETLAALSLERLEEAPGFVE